MQWKATLNSQAKTTQSLQSRSTRIFLSTLTESQTSLLELEKTRARWWDGLLCGCIILLAIFSTHPVAEMGFCDDFSYIKTAFIYAQTGHIVYNGWSAPILGWQIPWGALFIKLFGYSFTAVRWSMLPIAFATIWLFFEILIRLGINRRNAYFGALAFGLSPLFIPLASSFMTDISCEFVLILCLYLCLRAVTAKTNAAATMWLIAAAITNAVGGTVRQTAWLGVLVMVPSTIWLLRRRRIVLAGILAWCVSLAIVFTCMRWFKSQPYSVVEPLIPRAPLHAWATRFVRTCLEATLCLSLLLFPLLVLWLRRFKTFSVPVRILILLVAALFQTHFLNNLLKTNQLPWLFDFIGDLGLTPNFTFMLGDRPQVLSAPILHILAFIVIIVAMTFLIDLFRTLPSNDKSHIKSRVSSLVLPDPRISWHSKFWLFAPFATAYCLLVFSRSIDERCYDRYLLGLIPIVLVCLLKLYDQSFSQPLPIVSYLLLGIVALFCIAGTHDWYAMNRARIQAASILKNAGIPDTRFQLGLDYDGWTQLKYSPSISETSASNLLDSDHPLTIENIDHECILWSWKMTSAIHPEYFVVLKPMPCLAPSHFAPVTYRSWIPPFQRFLYIQQRPQ
jgi:hypothetical protein